MPKYPYIPFYTGDWLKDPALTICDPATRGIWIDLICAMHELDRTGELRMTTDKLARLARCSTDQLTHALTELQVTGTALITERNGVVTVINRRMQREQQERILTKNRVSKFRNKDDVTDLKRSCNGVVTPIDIGIDPKKEKGSGEKEKLEVRFMRFWDKYPKKVSKPDAHKAFLKLKPNDELLDQMLSALEVQSHSKDWLKEEGQFIPHPSTWLNKRRWEDVRIVIPKIDYGSNPTGAFAEVRS